MSTAGSSVERVAPKLNIGAEACLQSMYLTPENQEPSGHQKFVTNCVSKYAFPPLNGLWDWLIYRITNACKAVLGKSEWQIAQRIVHYSATEIAKTELEGRLKTRNPIPDSDQWFKTIKERVNYLTKRAADELLEKCLYAQNRPKVSMNKALQELDLKTAMNVHVGKMLEDYDAGMKSLAQAREGYLQSLPLPGPSTT